MNLIVFYDVLCKRGLVDPVAMILEARDHAHHSDLWQLPVKELKAGVCVCVRRLRGEFHSITCFHEEL